MTEQPKTFPSIQGRCPACRGESLFVGTGGWITCSRVDCPNPTAADELLHGTHDVARLTAEVRVATAELERLSAGEEPGYAEHAVPTPGQWIWKWNRASVEQRLDVAKRAIENAGRASTCFLMAHEKRLEGERQAWAALARVRAAVDRWKQYTLEPQTMRAVSEIGEALDQPMPLTDGSGSILCTCTYATPCGCGTSPHYDAPPCPGFPDRCPNPVDVPAQSPYHGGGMRCGCGDSKEPS